MNTEEASREYARQTMVRWRAQPGNREREREAKRKWRREHPELVKAMKKRYLQKHPYRERPYTKRHAEIKEQYYRHRVQWLLAGDVTREELIAIYERHNRSCAYCEEKVARPRFSPLRTIGFDHVKPLGRGGKNTAANIVVCCHKCNVLKGLRSVVGG